MQRVELDYGDSRIPVDLPDHTYVVRYGETYTDPPAVDPKTATRAALDNPIDLPPLRDAAGPDKKIVIGFPDRVKGGSGPDSHRKVSIPIILEELLVGGAQMENITLLCSVGLHRMNTLEEWNQYLGPDIVNLFYPDRLLNHDAEGEIIDMGRDEMGNVVQFSSLMAEADIPIVIGHCAGNPYGGFSGGYKMVVTGHTTAASIASHHTPGTMHRDDWMGAGTQSHMRHQFRSIGRAIEKKTGKPIFAVDAVIGQFSEVLGVFAGSVEGVEKASWPLASKRTHVNLNSEQPYDILLMGLPRNFHYGPGMGTNPILMSLAIGGQLSRCWHALRPDPVIIAFSQCDGWFNEIWFPSYEKTYWELQKFNSAAEFLASPESESLSRNPDYLYRYQTQYTYHPFHAMSMVSGGAIPGLRTSRSIIVGAEKPMYARGMGYATARTYEDGMKIAEGYTGKNPRILCTPECFSGGVAVHLSVGG